MGMKKNIGGLEFSAEKRRSCHEINIFSKWVWPIAILGILLLWAYFPTFVFQYMFGDDYGEIFGGGSRNWMIAATGRPLRYLIVKITSYFFRSNPEVFLMTDLMLVMRSAAFVIVLITSSAFFYLFVSAGIRKRYAVIFTAILFTTPAFIIKSVYFIYTVQYLSLLAVMAGFYFGFLHPLKKDFLDIRGAVIAVLCYAVSMSIYQAMIFYVGAFILLFLLFSNARKLSFYRIHMASCTVQMVGAYLVYKLTTAMTMHYYGLEPYSRFSGGLKRIFENMALDLTSDFWVTFAHWVYAEKYLAQWGVAVILISASAFLYWIYSHIGSLRFWEVFERNIYLLGSLSFAFLSYFAQPRPIYSQSGPAMCASLFVLIYSINFLWQNLLSPRLKSNGSWYKMAAASTVAGICIISANSSASSIAYYNSLEVDYIQTQIAKHDDATVNEIIQVVPYLKKWKTPELCFKVPCKGEFALKMTSLVGAANQQLRFARALRCKKDSACFQKIKKTTRVLKMPEKMEEGTAIIDMRPLYEMYKRRAERN